MIVSSRTPEGEPNTCPICGADVRIEPSLFFGDAPCPKCGTLLWFLNAGDRHRLYDYEATESLHQRFRDLITDHLNVPRGEIDNVFLSDLASDSLDIVELVMGFEDEFHIKIPDDDYDKILTVGDAIDYIQEKSNG